MQKHLYILLCVIIFSQVSVFAKKHRKIKHRKHRTTYRVKPKPQPAFTLDQVKAMQNVWGIDLSHHQSSINWEKLGNHQPNFMFIKATEGITHQDTKYIENYAEAKKRKILVGSYHFFSYKSSGIEQANAFLSIAQHRDSDLLPVLDAEFSKQMPHKDSVVSELKNFINTVYQKLGHYPIVYCNYRYYKLYLEDHINDKCKLWIVNYQNQPTCNWTFWQKTDRLKIDGVAGFVDLNIFNGHVSELKNMLYHSTIAAPEF